MTITSLVTVWSSGDPERGKFAPKVEFVIDLWYAHGVVMPKTDTLARSSPRSYPSTETQGFRYVEGNVPAPYIHALTGVLAAEARHPVTEALAFKALDLLALLEREGHGFAAAPKIEPLCPADQSAMAAEQGNAIAEEKHGTNHGTKDRKPVPSRYGTIRGRIMGELGLDSRKRRGKPREG